MTYFSTLHSVPKIITDKPIDGGECKSISSVLPLANKTATVVSIFFLNSFPIFLADILFPAAIRNVQRPL